MVVGVGEWNGWAVNCEDGCMGKWLSGGLACMHGEITWLMDERMGLVLVCARLDV